MGATDQTAVYLLEHIEQATDVEINTKTREITLKLDGWYDWKIKLSNRQIWEVESEEKEHFISRFRSKKDNAKLAQEITEQLRKRLQKQDKIDLNTAICELAFMELGEGFFIENKAAKEDCGFLNIRHPNGDLFNVKATSNSDLVELTLAEPANKYFITRKFNIQDPHVSERIMEVLTQWDT